MQRFKKKDLAKNSGPEYMVWWALMEALPKCSTEEEKKRLYDKREVVDVVFQMNGVDLDFRKVMNNWQSQIGRMITEKAQELVDSKFGDKVSDLCDIIDDARTKLKEHIKTQLIKEK